MSLLLVVFGTILGWIGTAVFQRVMDIMIPNRIPRRSLLDRGTRWFRGFLLLPRGDNRASPQTFDLANLIETDTSALVRLDRNPGFASFATFDGLLTEFRVSRRSTAIVSLVNLALPVMAFGPVVIEIVIASEFGAAFGPSVSSWLQGLPELVAILFSVIFGVIALVIVFGTFLFCGSIAVKFIERVNDRIFPFQLYIPTVLLSSLIGLDRRRFIITKGGQPSQDISRLRLGQYRSFETLLMFSPDRRVVRRIRLPTLSKNILQTIGEKVSLFALAKKLSESHGLPLVIQEFTDLGPFLRKRHGDRPHVV